MEEAEERIVLDATLVRARLELYVNVMANHMGQKISGSLREYSIDFSVMGESSMLGVPMGSKGY